MILPANPADQLHQLFGATVQAECHNGVCTTPDGKRFRLETWEKQCKSVPTGPGRMDYQPPFVKP